MPAYKYTLKSGKVMWMVSIRYKDWSGKSCREVKRGFKTQKEAKQYERSFLDTLTRSSDIQLSSLSVNYMDDMRHRLKPTTMVGKENIMNKWILPYMGNMKISDIDTLTIRNWQNRILEQGFSPTYQKSIHNQMSALMNYAVAHYGLPVNPCRLAGPIGSKKASEMSFWTQEEFEKFNSCVTKPGLHLAFEILFWTGIRLGELLAITPADIHEDKTLDINKTYAVVNGEELILTPKTSKSRRCISLPDFLYEDMLSYIGMMYEPVPEDRLFYFTKSAIEHEIKRAASMAGLEPIRVHDLRHSHASLLIHLGFSPSAVADRLGHESVRTTLDIYGHLYPSVRSEMANKLESLHKKQP